MSQAITKALAALVAAITADIKSAKPAAGAKKPVAKAAATAAPTKAGKAPAVVKAAVADGYKLLRGSDKIKVGDEWRLIAGVKHRDGASKRWRKVGDSVGKKAGDFTKSTFRRKV